MSNEEARRMERKKFGTWLRGMRQEFGLTQKQVAGKIGLGLQQYHRIETGKSKTKVEIVEYLADVLGVTPKEAKLRWIGVTDQLISLPPIFVEFFELPSMARKGIAAQIRTMHDLIAPGQN